MNNNSKNSSKNSRNNLLKLEYQVNNNISNSEFKVDKYLGKGTYGDIYRGRNKGNKKYYVIKVIDNSANNVNDINRVITELGFLKLLSLFPVSKKFINPCYDFGINDNRIITIFPALYGKSMKTVLESMVLLDSNQYYQLAKLIMKRLLQGVDLIHSKYVIHRNLNEKNIIIYFPKNNEELIDIKIVNFGLSCGSLLPHKKTKKANKLEKIRSNNSKSQKINSSKSNSSKSNSSKSNSSKSNPKSGSDLYFTTCQRLGDDIDLSNQIVSSQNVIKKIKNIDGKQLSTESKYLSEAQIKDIYDLGMIFWRMVNSTKSKHYQLGNKISKKTLKSFKGYSELYEQHNFIVKYMLNVPSKRLNANQLLEKFMFKEKYGW